MSKGPICFCGSGTRLFGSPYRNKDGSRKRYWCCLRFPECKGSVGAHPNGKPLGYIADPETKKSRIAAHNAMDPLWKHGGMNRSDLYVLIAKELGIAELHIGFADIELCRRVEEVVRDRSWEKTNGSSEETEGGERSPL